MNCAVCQKEFKPKRKSCPGKLCSCGCIGEFNRRRITGIRDESKHEIYRCLSCGMEGDRLKNGKNGKIRKFCSRSCKSLYFFAHGVRERLHSRGFIVVLRNGTALKVKSRWEAAFIKDYLEEHGLKWMYEPKRFELSSGKGYYPDFFIADENLWVEVKGTKYYDQYNKTGDFAREFPELNYVVADHGVLMSRFGLDLSQERLHEVCATAQER